MGESQGSKYEAMVEAWIGDALSKDTAQIYATLAVAEQLRRMADALERAYPEPLVDPREPGQSWDEYRADQAAQNK